MVRGLSAATSAMSWSWSRGSTSESRSPTVINALRLRRASRGRRRPPPHRQPPRRCSAGESVGAADVRHRRRRRRAARMPVERRDRRRRERRCCYRCRRGSRSQPARRPRRSSRPRAIERQRGAGVLQQHDALARHLERQRQVLRRCRPASDRRTGGSVSSRKQSCARRMRRTAASTIASDTMPPARPASSSVRRSSTATGISISRPAVADGTVLCVPNTQSDSTKPLNLQSPFRMSCSRWTFSRAVLCR